MVCLHHHPIPMGSRWLDGVGLAEAHEFWRIIEANRNVRAVVWVTFTRRLRASAAM